MTTTDDASPEIDPDIDPGPDADEIENIGMEALFEIGMGQRECDDTKVRVAAQAFVATHMRAQGYEYRAIAAEMGISLGWCFDLVKRTLKRLEKKTMETAETVRQLQLARLDKLLAGHMERAETDPFVVPMVLQIMDRIDKLWGIEPPKRIEHKFTEDDVNATRNALAAALASGTLTTTITDDPSETTT